MVGHQLAAGQDLHQKCATAVNCHNSCRFSAQPWHYHWQSAVTGYIQCQLLHPHVALSAAAATTSYNNFVH